MALDAPRAVDGPFAGSTASGELRPEPPRIVDV